MKRKGFTLVELVIVIAILAILAAYAIPKYEGLIDEARSAQARAQLGTVRSALGIQYAKNRGLYPAALNGTIFAEGVVPAVDTGSGAISTVTAGDGDGDADDETFGTTGGWMYDVNGTRTIAEVRINDSDTDPVTSSAWNTY